MPFEFAFGRKPLATALIAGGLIAFSAPAAHAQFFNFFFHNEGLDAGDVQSMLEDRGLQLVAPLRRNGGVYIADVEGPRGGHFRLIVDAESGRVMQRFRLSAPRFYSDYAGPRPPADMNEADSNAQGQQGPFSSAPGAPPPAVITFGQSLARGEDASNGPNVLSVPEDNAKTRPKPQVKQQHKKIELTPLPQPAQNAAPSAPAASDAKQPVHAEAAPAPSGAETKAAAAPAPAAPQPVAAPPPAPATAKAKPAINDVPVTPLD